MMEHREVVGCCGGAKQEEDAKVSNEVTSNADKYASKYANKYPYS